MVSTKSRTKVIQEPQLNEDKKFLTRLCISARSLGNKQEELELLLWEHHFATTGMTGSWRDDSPEWMIRIHDYHLVRKGHVDKRGGDIHSMSKMAPASSKSLVTQRKMTLDACGAMCYQIKHKRGHELVSAIDPHIALGKRIPGSLCTWL